MANARLLIFQTQRLLTSSSADDLDVTVRIVDILVRLRKHVCLFPDPPAAPALTTSKYVSMEAMLSTSPCVSSGRTIGSNEGMQDQKEGQAFAHLHLSIEMQRGCQEIIDAASEVYIKAFALCLLLRTELLQVCAFICACGVLWVV